MINIYRLMRLLQEPTLLTLYYAFVYPYFTYCITVWGNTYATVLDSLMKAQNRAVRIVAAARKYDCTIPIFRRLNILSLSRLYVYFARIFLYKYRQQQLPGVFNDFFTQANKIHSYDTRQNTHFRPPLAKYFPRSSSIRCSGAIINNTLIQFQNLSCSFPTFKYEVRKCLSTKSDEEIQKLLKVKTEYSI